MGRETNIQWCDSTVNPVMGCDGCELWNGSTRICYAGVMHGRYQRNAGFAKHFDQPEKFPGRMKGASEWGDLRGKDREDKPWLNGLPRMIFVSDMGDALSKAIDLPWLDSEICSTARSLHGRRHNWLWLTKRPSRMYEFSKDLPGRWPENLWAMTSVSDRASSRRAKMLLNVGRGSERVIRGVSFEPLREEPDWTCLEPRDDRRIHWAIFGGMSRQESPDAWTLDVEWLRRGIEACRRYEVSPFVKQLGAKPISLTIDGGDSHNGDWSRWPEWLRVREVPRCVA